MKIPSFTFGYRDEHLCLIENKAFLRNNLDVQYINKTIPEMTIIGNFWVTMAFYFIF